MSEDEFKPFDIKIDIKRKCPYCDNGNLGIDKEKNELICDNCGRVKEDPEDTSAKIPTYEIKKTKVSDETKKEVNEGITKIDKMTSDIELPKNVRATAGAMYKMVIQKNLIKGKSENSILSAILYAAHKKAEEPITLEEIADISTSDKDDIEETLKFLIKEIPLKFLPSFSIRENVEDIVNKLDNEKASEKLKQKYAEEGYDFSNEESNIYCEKNGKSWYIKANPNKRHEVKMEDDELNFYLS